MTDDQIFRFGQGVLATAEFALSAGLPRDMRLLTWFGGKSGFGANLYPAGGPLSYLSRPWALFRAVDQREFAVMVTHGMKWQPSPGGGMGKYFWPNPAYAMAWGKALTNESNWYGAGAHILYSPLPLDVYYESETIADLSRYGMPNATIIWIPNYELGKIPPATIVGYVPGR